MDDNSQEYDDVVEGKAQEWFPKTEHDAEWVIGKLADIRERRTRLTANYKLMIDELTRDEERLVKYYGNSVRSIAEKMLEAIKWKKKHVKFLNGKVQFRTYSASIDVPVENRQELIKTAITTERPTPEEPGRYFAWIVPVQGYWKLDHNSYIRDRMSIKEVIKTNEDDGEVVMNSSVRIGDTEVAFAEIIPAKVTCHIDNILIPETWPEGNKDNGS